MYPASMTKVMTAVIALQSGLDPDSTVTITDAMWAGLIEADASTAGFWPGDEVTVRELLYGVLLPSGADAVNALAFTISGSVDAFVAEMNRRAAELGMDSTHFTNPTGLPDEDHYSSARDMAVLMNYALSVPGFAEIIHARSYTTRPLSSAPDGVLLESTSWEYINNVEDSFSIPGYLGGKTGYTRAAGRCLASAAEFNGMKLVLVTGRSDGIGAIQDASIIYNWANDRYENRQLLKKGDILLEEVLVNDTLGDLTFPLEVPEDLKKDLPKNAVIEVTHDVPAVLQAPLAQGERIGTLKVTADGQTVYTTELYSPIDAKYSRIAHIWNVLKRFFLAHKALCITLPALLVLCIIVRIWAVNERRKQQKRRHRRKK